MIVPILCLVCLCLLAWVIMLKLDMERLKDSHSSLDSNSRTGGKRKASGVKGMQSFDVG